ncbi:MAG: outer membrane lipoprotein carrier protein LolA [Bacteroidota bacterium]
MRMIALLLALALLTPLGTVRAEDAMLKAGDVLRGRFVQERHLQGFAKPVRSEGSFVVAPGKGLIWRAETPFAVTTVVSPAGLVQSVGGTETNRLSADRLPFLSKLYDMMSGALAGDWRALETTFKVTRNGADIALVPQRPDDLTAQQISSIGARVGRFVERVEIVKPNGDFDRLSFLDQSVNGTPLDAAEAALLR